MMAVRAGCCKVYACELSGVMAKLSQNVFAANGVLDHVKLIHSLSTKLSVPKDIPERFVKCFANTLLTLKSCLLSLGSICLLFHECSDLRFLVN